MQRFIIQISQKIDEKRVNVLFLSPYSYMLNPIEFSFSKIKSIVRRSLASGSNESFTNIILNSVNQLTKSDLQSYSRNIGRNCLKAIGKEDFNQKFFKKRCGYFKKRLENFNFFGVILKNTLVILINALKILKKRVEILYFEIKLSIF
ncbi:hypothetical protein DMUE_0843 [Dictyocoela muelleri]|nr:hypothetical protein DMUE_0843 [Dictyocoela muelleri]